ncbi:BON domain-containing protein [Gemmata sp. G18]|uniref:BON domain-containing protein n=1 Tax=Gemmata palustris TaxID=2822762 RepID=A0ABS5BJ48_9BACT|nr:BON domain-containing protein [Gemmata palustris]MBP3953726.1 BON domain-containing protein [Gemmata palustris]
MNTCPIMTSELIDALTSSPLGQLRRLRVTENENEVVLTGQVSSYYLKQMAQETIRIAVGVRRLLNRVEVCAADAA